MSLIVRCQRGFTTVTLMGVLSVGMLLVAGGYAAVGPDSSMSRKDQDSRQAYAAAEAGLQWYLSNLAKDNDYYASCTSVPNPAPGQLAPVNQAWNGSGADPRRWRNLPGETSQYTVELIPSPGYSTCTAGDQYSIIDPSGNFTLRVSGRSRGQTRTIRVTLRRRNFLDFIYFTHFETFSPLAYATTAKQTWASANCAKFRTQRNQVTYTGSDRNDGTTNPCALIQFAPEDAVLGPFHSNDSILACGGPTFGRDSRDAIELNEKSPGWTNQGCGSSASPDFDGSVVFPAGQLGMPTSNSELLGIAQSSFIFSGKTEILLKGDKMDYRVRGGSWQTNKSLPANGVIYVSNFGNCSSSFSYLQTYPNETNCGNAWVKGSYKKELTIAAANDVVINGDITRDSSDQSLLLGLIGNNFVRVYHPITTNSSGACSGNATGSLSDPEIEAAILALNHSFIVDNWHCGNKLGDLKVYGAIAQYYRGPVGTGGSSSSGTGYIKVYTYNDRLRYREPPYFVDPVQSSWRVARQTEQLPAVK